MSEQQPPQWFDGQIPQSDGDKDWEKRRRAFLEELPQLMERRKRRDRVDNFYPYLLVRSVLGDRGDRPFNTCFWESPDIWTAPGDPAMSPAVPANHGGSVTAGKAHTVYAHVWNLGFAPLAGIFVEFYWFNPSLGINGASANLIGIGRCELSGRGMSGSHKLVKCPKPWVPKFENSGHECLVVRLSGIGDPLGANEWSPWLNRHVAQRNISVLPAGASISHLVENLNVSRPFNTRIQFIQLGGREAELARHIAVPKLQLANVETHVLSELNIGNEIVQPRLGHLPAGALASVHPMAAGGAPRPPLMRQSERVRMVDPGRLFRSLRDKDRRDESHLARLLDRVGELHRESPTHNPPNAEEAQVMRLATYSGEQLVGGYTIVVAGRSG